MFDKLKSRKFWFALLGALLPILTQLLTGELGWETALTLAIGVIVTYIFGQGYVDGQEKSTAQVTSDVPGSDG